jgi:hypothetical protein
MLRRDSMVDELSSTEFELLSEAMQLHSDSHLKVRPLFVNAESVLAEFVKSLN